MWMYYEEFGQIIVQPLPRGTIRLGRDEACVVRINDARVSRVHCELKVCEDALWVRDLASRNGTWLNGHPLGADFIGMLPGDEIRLGGLPVQLEISARHGDQRSVVPRQVNAPENLGDRGGAPGQGVCLLEQVVISLSCVALVALLILWLG